MRAGDGREVEGLSLLAWEDVAVLRHSVDQVDPVGAADAHEGEGRRRVAQDRQVDAARGVGERPTAGPQRIERDPSPCCTW